MNSFHRILFSGGAVLAILVSAACGGGSPPRDATSSIDPAGTWRAVLESPGGELPFGLVIERKPDGGWSAASINGEERVPFEAVGVSGRQVRLEYSHYDSAVTADLDESGGSMKGKWARQAGKDRPAMIFRAERLRSGAELTRFGPPEPDETVTASGAPADVTGSWDVVFKDDDASTEPARAEFRQQGARLLGTFLTPTGDYRYLEGDYANGLLRLSCFDGGHAFLFKARAAADGSLQGDFWSRSASHSTWTAKRASAQTVPGEVASAGSSSSAPTPTSGGSYPAMPDPFAMTKVRNPSGELRFDFPDLDGKRVASTDPLFKGKVLLVDIFGSWCPNCNDQAPVLADLYRRYHEKGLEIVGLAYEMTGDPNRDVAFVRRHAQRYGITWPLLLAGTNAKADRDPTLPDLEGILAFPTLVFVGRDGKVKAIHTGFAGPGTGEHFTALKKRYESLLEELLGRTRPPA